MPLDRSKWGGKDRISNIEDAIDALQTSGGAVSSVFTRTGAVTAQSGDYTAAQVGAVDVANGGKETVSTVAASGSAQTISLANGNVFDITLTANCTFTLSGATNGKGCRVTLILRQDGTGSRTVTWPTVTWAGGFAPVLQTAASSVDFVVLETVDGGTTWYGWYETGGAPGSEIGYDQITANVTVSSTTESSGTTVITCAAHTFDGGPVIVEFFSPLCNLGATAGEAVTVSLFESSTQIGRLLNLQNPAAANFFAPLIGKYRFTPSAGSHTYTVTAFKSGASAAVIGAGTPGTGAYMPTYVRFTKV